MADLATALTIAAYVAYFIALFFPFGLAAVFTGITFAGFFGVIGGFENPFILIFGMFAGVGFVCGSIVRVISAFFYERKKLFVVALVHLLGVLLVPTIIRGPAIYAELRDGTLLGAANYDNITFIIDGKRITTPGFNIVNAFCAFGKNGQQLIHLYLDDQNKKRQFCGKFNNGDKPITVQSAEFRFAQLDEAIKHNRFLSLCNSAVWPKEVCEFKAETWRKTPDYYPFKLTVIEKSELQRFLMNRKWEENNYAFATTTEKLENLEVNDFRFNSDAFTWINKVYEDDVNFYLLNCSTTAKLRCTALERTKNKTFIYYSFEADADRLKDDAKNIHAKMNEFVEIISK